MLHFNNLRPFASALSNGFARRHSGVNGVVQYANQKIFLSPPASSSSSQQQAIRAIPTRLFGCKRGTPNAPPGKIEIYNEQKTIPDIDIPRIEKTISTIQDIIGYPEYDISLTLVDDDAMQQTNMETRGVDRPTDILSFQIHALKDPKVPGDIQEPEVDLPDYYTLGDMVLDVPYVIRRCEEDREFYESDEQDVEPIDDDLDEFVGDDYRGVSGVMSTIYDPQERIQLLLVHGMLHLVGYDHIEDDDYELMVTKEEHVIIELQERLKTDWVDVVDPLKD